MDFFFISHNEEFINELRCYFETVSSVTCICGDIREASIKNTAFISPSNSLISMDTGIDKIYNEELFPYIKLPARKKLRSLETKTLLGRDFLPVGSAMIIEADHEMCSHIIFAPIMFVSQDISHTSNVYHSFLASLCVLKKFKNEKINKLVHPGIDDIDPKLAAQQLYHAFLDFVFVSNIPFQILHIVDRDVYITEQKNEDQPNYFENLEIKEIDIEKIVYK